MSNPLSWLPLANLLGNAWNVYAVTCVLVVFAAGVRLTKHTKKPLLYRVILSFLIAWCLQLVFIELVGMISNVAILSTLGKFNPNSLSWVEKVGPIYIELRPLYTIMPACVLGYFGFVDKKVEAPERMFNWNKKWVIMMVLTVTAFAIIRNLIGINLPQVAYPSESIERYIVYYLFYVPTYTVYAILGVKLYSKRPVNLQ